MVAFADLKKFIYLIGWLKKVRSAFGNADHFIYNINWSALPNGET